MSTAQRGRRALDGDQRRVLGALLSMQRQSWEQGVAGHALLDLRVDDLVRVLARDAVIRQTPAGKLAEIDDRGLVNCAANAEAVRWAAEADDDPALAEAWDAQLRWIRQTCPRAADGTLFHLEGTREVWADTVYMVVPLLAALGDLPGALVQLAGHRARLFDESTQLYGARWDEDSRCRTQPEAWGTGNGWVVAAIARALHHLGGRAGELRREWAPHAHAVIDACLAHRDSDGLFHNVVDDPATFREANLAQMLAYAILSGVADRWLPAEYAPVGRSLVWTARRQIDRDGFVTGVCGAPHFDRPGISAEAQAFFLLASAAERRLES